MLAEGVNAGAIAHEGRDRVARQKALGMMHEADRVTMHRVRDRQQLKVAEMGAQDENAALRIAGLQLVKVFDAVVAHALLKPAVEKAAQPDVFGSGAAEIDVRGAQDSLCARRAGDRETRTKGS